MIGINIISAISWFNFTFSSCIFEGCTLFMQLGCFVIDLVKATNKSDSTTNKVAPPGNESTQDVCVKRSIQT